MTIRFVSFYRQEENWHHDELREIWDPDDSEQQTIPSQASENGEEFYLALCIAHAPARQGRNVQYQYFGVKRSPPAAGTLHVHDDDDPREEGKEEEKSRQIRIVSSLVPGVISSTRIKTGNKNGRTTTTTWRNKNHHNKKIMMMKMNSTAKKANKMKRTMIQDNHANTKRRRCRYGETCRLRRLKGVCIFDHDQDEHPNNIKTRKRKDF